jgi:pyruvate/2-oxoglutarate dehydrogenase complex dihydrolipoamide dehydrogenase (E3) component
MFLLMCCTNAGVDVKENNGAIVVDSEMHTSADNVSAGGEVVGKPMLETLAAKEGATAAENALTGTHKRIDFLSEISDHHILFTIMLNSRRFDMRL